MWFWLKLFWIFMFAWNIGLFMKKCPNCGHYMRWHKKIGGRFVD